MNELKCPFCQQELVQDNVKLWSCGNPECRESEHYFGTEKMWQELITTRKALDVAIRGLDQMTWGCDRTDAEYLLKEIKEITALKQKDVK